MTGILLHNPSFLLFSFSQACGILNNNVAYANRSRSEFVFMKDKFVSVFFSAVSLTIWAATISVIVFALVLLCTGMKKPPQFTLNETALEAVDPGDEILAQNEKSGDGWFCLTLHMTVSAAKHSPFSYKAEGFTLEAPADLVEGDEWFTLLDAPLDYSKIAPDDFVLRLYIRAPEGEAALRERLPELSFAMQGLTGYFTFIRCPIKPQIYGFALSDFPAGALRPADAAA